MTIEQFKNNWQPQMDRYARFSFNLDLKELVQQIRTDAEAEHKSMCESCIHKVSADDIESIRNSGVRLLADRLLEYDKPITKDDILDELMFFKENKNELPNNTND